MEIIDIQFIKLTIIIIKFVTIFFLINQALNFVHKINSQLFHLMGKGFFINFIVNIFFKYPYDH